MDEYCGLAQPGPEYLQLPEEALKNAWVLPLGAVQYKDACHISNRLAFQ